MSLDMVKLRQKSQYFVNHAFDTDEGDDLTRGLITDNKHQEKKCELKKCEDSKNENGKLVSDVWVNRIDNLPLLGTPESKMLDISGKVAMQKRRDQGLTDIRGTIESSLHGFHTLDLPDIQALLEDRGFSQAFFVLFDARGSGSLEQSAWFGQLRFWAKV